MSLFRVTSNKAKAACSFARANAYLFEKKTLYPALSLSRKQSLRTLSANAVYKFSMSPQELDVIRTTLPAVGAVGPDFTKHFYTRMFKAEPRLKNVFNQTNQEIGKQPQKLFQTIAFAASAAIDTGELNAEGIESICQKHCALQLDPSDYNIVGEHLLGTIKDLLTDEPSVIDAWASLYGNIAGAFTAREKEIYDEAMNVPGGWKGLRPFKLGFKEDLSKTIRRITFMPVDHKPVPKWKAGKFTTVWADLGVGVEGKYGRYTTQPRHYTLNFPHSAQEGEHSFAIAVKRDGLISSMLHDAEVGSVFNLSAPFGCFDMSDAEKLWLVDSDVPVIFISAGVGITPVMAMLENCYITRPATWLHANANGEQHAYRDRIREITAVRDGMLQRRVWYTDPLPEDGDPAGNDDNIVKYHFRGLMELEKYAEQFPREVLHLHDSRAQYFICGPPPFMNAQKGALIALGIDEKKIHHELF